MKLLLATRSAHKAAEVRRILAAAPPLSSIRLISLDDAAIPESPEEDGLERFDTFEENAVGKAEWFARLSGLPTVADDSGLEVDALGGRPGVRTKRFAPLEAYPGLSRDEANNSHLLRLMAGVPQPRRGARYVCVATFALPGEPNPATFRGEAPGRILESPRGAGGFGYDPVVFAPSANCAYAELAPDEKDRRSHRGRAFRALAAHMADLPHLAEPRR